MKPRNKLYFMECHIAGRQYHEAGEVWDKLTIGTELYLELDKENPHDLNAVAILYRDPSNEEEYLLGYVPRAENKTLSMFLEMGHSDIFECKLCRKDEEAHYEQQLSVTIKIRRKGV